jgi:hypothetical protein
VASAAVVPAHVVAIVEFSEMMGAGLPCEWWAVREFLPTLPLALCPRFGNMPVCREFRYFVKDSTVLCRHPYWPANALEQGGVPDALQASEGLAHCTELSVLDALASRAGAVVGGEWSIDFLETGRGWYLTDLAEAHKSWHWPNCPAARC